nr:MAG TPA: hypothetical protein [Bacteriophage sp.]
MYSITFQPNLFIFCNFTLMILLSILHKVN